MIYLAITPVGLKEALQLKSNGGSHHIWCGSDLVFDLMSIKDVSQFNYPLMGASLDIIEGALETIREHHPGEVVWVEGCLR
ncbi:hypothetical protein [Acidovorax sp. SUPP2825]|uniref:hypothetical protein n=1 Tax=Acidovorax sp. SUPP2825 TaxID=2920879 RepID=UPI0023DE6520|nr:hypothetical protein [Acidovorax sp. SUPP2825]GKS97518.1 hypothetical protein AVAK2825_23305 [Acidovorax sp. SUPP2825]